MAIQLEYDREKSKKSPGFYFARRRFQRLVFSACFKQMPTLHIGVQSIGCCVPEESMSIRSKFRIALGAVGLITTSCFATVNHNPANGTDQVWKEYVYKAAGFAVTAPKPPREQDWDPSRVFEFSLDSDLNLRLEVSKPKRDCAEFERWATQHGSSKQRKLLLVAGHTAVDQWSRPPNATRLFFTRATCINSTTYIFAADWVVDVPGQEIDDPRPEIVRKIMDSFRVVDKEIAGGESGIRTHVRVSPKHAFQACAFSHSAISPAHLIGTNHPAGQEPAAIMTHSIIANEEDQRLAAGI
jgi:hypothetical protein